jgi:glycosyltransferase involved in cell wall biosynthesis
VQTQLKEEVIVAKKRSQDNNAYISFDASASAQVPVRVLRLPKNSGGPSKPLNIGVSAARGDWIALLDHDDLMTPTRLANQLRAAKACPDVGLILGRLHGRASTANRDRLVDKAWAVLSSLPYTEVTPGIRRVAAADAWGRQCYRMGVTRCRVAPACSRRPSGPK